jgi:acyl-homoserine-lactone acylase
MLSRYRILEKLSEGGIGIVWKAVDTTLDHEAALSKCFRTLWRQRNEMLQKKMIQMLVAGLILASGFAACDTGKGARYQATIRRTAFGIPHILADDWGGLGFGEGYAQAEDNACDLADQVLRARGLRARYFGAGENDRHVQSDTVVRGLRLQERSAAEFETQAADFQEYYRGYAAGYNDYLATVGVKGLKGCCAGAAWVGEITAVDLVARYRLAVESMTNWDAVPLAVPPGTSTARLQNQRTPAAGPTVSLHSGPEGLGSNGWAIGSERAAGGRGMLVANPHFWWHSASRFSEKHLTLRGRLDVYGVHVTGLPGVIMGFNRNVAWTQTVSAGKSVTFYQLKLVPGEPTKYVYDGEQRSMQSRRVQIEVGQDDGTLEKVEKTVWLSHYGPVVTLPDFPWSEEQALTVRDVHYDNQEAGAQYLAMDQAGSMEAFQQAHADHTGLPWLNTIAVSPDGLAWYAGGSTTPDLSHETIELWLQRRQSDEATKRMWAKYRRVLLDGSDSRFEWQVRDGARDPGILPFAELPQMERRDYVFNANGSHWVPHATARLEGYSPLTGEEGTRLSPRSRMNAILLADTSADGPAGEDARFTRDELAAAILSNRGLTAELLRGQVVQRCRTRPQVQLDDRTVDLTAACQVLAAWDGLLNLDSRGAVLWREFLGQQQDGPLFAEKFDRNDPVGTPRGLLAEDHILIPLARAVDFLRDRDIELDTPLGTLQHTMKGERGIPLHGGQQIEGVANVVRLMPNLTTLEPQSLPAAVEGSSFLRASGYPVNFGTSFLMVLEYTESGPSAQALLTNSQSSDPASPHFADQMDLFSAKQWRPVLFEEGDILADPELTVLHVSGG